MGGLVLSGGDCCCDWGGEWTKRGYRCDALLTRRSELHLFERKEGGFTAEGWTPEQLGCFLRFDLKKGLGAFPEGLRKGGFTVRRGASR